MVKLVHDVPKELVLFLEHFFMFPILFIYLSVTDSWKNFETQSFMWTMLFSLGVAPIVCIWIHSSSLISVGENSIIHSFDKVWGYIIGYILYCFI